jgi:hypothetical protein
MHSRVVSVEAGEGLGVSILWAVARHPCLPHEPGQRQHPCCHPATTSISPGRATHGLYMYVHVQYICLVRVLYSTLYQGVFQSMYRTIWVSLYRDILMDV